MVFSFFFLIFLRLHQNTVDWEYFPFHEPDWHCVKQHCLKLLDGRAWDVGSLATVITEHQKEVGSAIKLGERTSDAVAIGSVVNMNQFHNAPCIKQVTEFVVSKFEGDNKKQMIHVLTDKNTCVGLFVNERILNVPPLLALQLHLSIFEEMESHTSNFRKNNPPNMRAPYQLDYFLFITLAYNESAGESSEPRADMKKRKDKATQLEWFHPEEEIYMKHAVCHVAWPITVQDQASRWTFDGPINQSKVIMLVPTSAIPKIAKKFEEILEGNYSD